MRLYRIWDVVYPVGIYYVLTNLMAFIVSMFVPYSVESYGFIKVLTTLFTFPFIYRIYRMDKLRRGEPLPQAGAVLADAKTKIPFLFAVIIMGACAAVVLNNMIAWTPLMEQSDNYGKVSEAFFGGPVLFEILGPCIFIPVLEEYVFRGLVYQRLREWMGVFGSVIISAVIFGMMHMNMVQFVYAGLLGIFIALCEERSRGLYAAILAHMSANTISVIRTETTWLDWMERSMNATIGTTIGLALIFIALFVFFFGNKFVIHKTR